jgi:serine phosphatase RsbU (regulator of sigma subunit)/DNA-binding NarL/FixJ family response regulator
MSRADKIRIEGNRFRKTKILALDDDIFIRKVLEGIFKDDYTFKVVGSAKDFDDAIVPFAPDIVLIDVVLPDGNGIDICAKLRAQSNNDKLYILILTSFDDAASIESAYSAGANDYIRKPFIPFEIVSKIGHIAKTIGYENRIISLYQSQKRSNGRLILLTELIKRNIHSADRNALLSSIKDLSIIFGADYCEMVFITGENIESGKSINLDSFRPVDYSVISRKMKIFGDMLMTFEAMNFERSDKTRVFCQVEKLFYNKTHEGFLVLQRSRPFASETKELVSLYLDFVNIMGIDIFSRQILENEVQRERKELAKVRSLQVSLLPDFKEIHKYDIASTFIPMEEISGDFFDAFYTSENMYQIVLCDVAGHGMASSYIGSSIRGLLRSVDYTNLTPSQIITSLNNSVVKNLSNTYYFSSLILCSLNLESDEVIIVSAGHPPCLYYNSIHNQYEQIEKTGPLLGLVENSEYEERKISLRTGDCLLMYTDGITEAQSEDTPALYGEERLFTLFQEIHERSSIDIVHSVVGSVYEYTGYASLNDDVTAICLKKKT